MMALRQAQGTSVVLATHNEAKLAELRRILATEAPTVQVLGLADAPPYPEPAENERTFAGERVAQSPGCATATGLPALATRLRMEVEVLTRCPASGRRRWARTEAGDADNNALLLRQLADVPAAGRVARLSAPWLPCCRTVPNMSAWGSCRVTGRSSGGSEWFRLRPAVRGRRAGR